MNIIGFEFTKVLGTTNRNPQALTINNHIGFDLIESEKISTLNNMNTLKAHFTYKLSYSEQNKKDKEDALIEFKGSVIMSVTKEEEKEFIKLSKKKEYSSPIFIPLFNFIMHKCSIKALPLEDELGLHPHLSLPRLTPKNN